MGIGSGLIVMWSGLLANIPNGWLLCDGTSGTPDLREKFVQGAADGIDPGASGGASSHTHDFTSDTHNHVIVPGSGLAPGVLVSDTTTSVPVTGITDATSSKPPFFDLAFLMKS